MIRDESEHAGGPPEINPKEEPAPSTGDASSATRGAPDAEEGLSDLAAAAAAAAAAVVAASSSSSSPSRESFINKAAGKQQEVVWGPEYSPATAKYVVGTRDSKSHPSKYRHDEVFEFLRGERVGEPVYPCRLREAGANKQRLKEFRKSVRRSFALTESEGELLLMHEVLPGHRAGEGSRSPSHGLKIVPTKAMVKLLVCKEHAEMHYGSTITDLNKDYVVPNGYLLEVRADVKRQCKLCGEATNAAAVPPPRRLGAIRMLSSHNESGAPSTTAEPTFNHEQDGSNSGGSGGGGGGGGSGAGGHEGIQRQDLHTPPRVTVPNGQPPDAERLQHAPAFSVGPPSAGAGAGVARSRENAPCGEDILPRSSRKRPLPPDPTVVLLDELSVGSVSNAILGVPRPGVRVLHPAEDRQRVGVVVWNVGHCGDGDGPEALLPELVDHLVRRSAVDEHTRVLVVDDETSSSLEVHRRGDSGGGGGGGGRGGFKRGHDDVVRDTVEAAMHAMKVFEDDKVSKTTVEAHMAHAQFLDSAKFITAGMVEVFLDSGRAAAIPDKIKAHLLRRGRSSVVLAREDPSLHPHDESGRHPRLLIGKRICRARQARTPCAAHAPDREWDLFLRDTRLPGRCAPSRSLYPSVETLEALLCRSGATLTNGVVVIASDPFGAWAEACARLRLSCVVFVGAKPTADVRRQVESMWRKTISMAGGPR